MPRRTHRRLARADHEPRGLVADGDEAADPLLDALLVEHPREHQMQARDAAPGDPVLRAVDDIAVAAPVGAGGHLAGRAPRAGLGDADRGLVAGEHQLGAEPLLRLGAVVHEGRDRPHVRLDDDAAGDAARLRHLVDHERHVEEAPSLAAVRPGNGHAHEPGEAQRLDVVPGVLLGAVHLGRPRLDDGLRELAGVRLQRLLLGRQLELRRTVRPVDRPRRGIMKRHRVSSPDELNRIEHTTEDARPCVRDRSTRSGDDTCGNPVDSRLRGNDGRGHSGPPIRTFMPAPRLREDRLREGGERESIGYHSNHECATAPRIQPQDALPGKQHLVELDVRTNFHTARRRGCATPRVTRASPRLLTLTDCRLRQDPWIPLPVKPAGDRRQAALPAQRRGDASRPSRPPPVRRPGLVRASPTD